MDYKLKEKALKLRIKREMSYHAIRKRLGIPKSTLANWLADFPLSKKRVLELRRKNWKKNEAKIELYRATMRERKLMAENEYYEKYKRLLKNLSRNSFFVAGLALYLAE